MTISRDSLERFDTRLATVLAWGVVASAGLLATGLAVLLAAGRGPAATRLLDTGLVVLMLTPAARVVVSLVEYVVARDWVFAGLTLAVLGILVATLLTALGAR